MRRERVGRVRTPGRNWATPGTFTESKFRQGNITIMEDEPTMESVLRRLREIVANSKDLEDAPDPKALPEEIALAIRD
jgi:hypothetical protein